MKKQIVIFALFLVLFSCITIATKPVIQEQYLPVGYIIKYPEVYDLKQGQTQEFNFHIFNYSTGEFITNESVDCWFHLYNTTGEHIYTENVTKFDNLWDFKVIVDGNNFTNTGMYSYIFQCASTSLTKSYTPGGFTSVQIEVSKTGLDLSKSQPVVLGICGFGLIAILILFALGYIFYKEDNLLYFLSFLCWYIALLVPAIVLKAINFASANNDMIGFLDNILIIYLIFYMFMLMILIIYFMILLFSWMTWKKTPKWKRTEI